MSAGHTGGPVHYPSRFISWVYRGKHFSISPSGESLKMFTMVDVEFEPTTLETHGLATTPFAKVLVGH